jgi:PGF-CTERM protein
MVSPSSPAALSTVALSITISGAAPAEVRVTVEECNGRTGICYPDIQNVSMSLDDGAYKAAVTLKHADATYITCKVLANADGSWKASEEKKIDLSENTNGDTNGDGENGNGTPGFEVLGVLVALGVLLVVIRRKRA